MRDIMNAFKIRLARTSLLINTILEVKVNP